jgi:hypothetical protein
VTSKDNGAVDQHWEMSDVPLRRSELIILKR